MPVNRKSTVLPIGLLFFLMVGCASSPETPSAAPLEQRTGDVADRAAGYAAQLVGRPYRYGGASPTTGFDCSGLVQYSYARAGRKLPRSTDDQRVAAQRIKLSELQPGDLVFFDQ